MAYTPTTHDALCTCETTQETTQDGWTSLPLDVVATPEFTQEEIDRWN